MRHAAAFAAGEIGEEEVIEPLRRAAVKTRTVRCSWRQSSALGEIGGNSARVALQDGPLRGQTMTCARPSRRLCKRLPSTKTRCGRSF